MQNPTTSETVAAAIDVLLRDLSVEMTDERFAALVDYVSVAVLTDGE